MTDDDLYTLLVRWVTVVTGRTVIRAHESGPTPPLPFVMLNFTGAAEVRDNHQVIEYVEGAPSVDYPEGVVTASPVIETEWRYSVHAYGTAPTDILRPIKSAAKLNQIVAMIEGRAAVNIFDVSQVRDLPEWINGQWEPRAQMDINLRGLTRDGFVVDVIDAIEPFNITRM